MKTILLAFLTVGIFNAPVIKSSLADETATPTQSDHEKHHPKGKAQAEPSPEMRKDMAKMHRMMADCLDSDKPMSECKKEMMDNCPMMKAGKHCPMMGEMDEMMGMHQHGKKSAKADDADHKAHHPDQGAQE